MTSLFAVLILAALVLMQLLIGGGDGTRLIYVLPSYLLVGLTGVLTLFSLPKARTRLDRGSLATVIVLSAYLVARMALSPVESLARVDFLILLGSLLVYAVTAHFVTGTGQRIAIVMVLLFIGLGHVAVGVFQFAKDPNFNPLVFGGRGDPSQRASGLFVCPNHLAGFLNVVFIFGVSFFFWGGLRVWAKVLVGYLTLVALAGIVLTGSRGGYLSAAAGIAVFAILSVWALRSALSQQMVPRIMGIVAAVAILAGVFAIASNQSYLLRVRANTVFVSEDIRFPLWEAAWKQFKIAPVFGTGSRTYLYYGRMFRAPEMRTDPTFVHNDYLQTLAEYGIVGLALALIFIGTHLRHAWQRWLGMVEKFASGVPQPADRWALALQLGGIATIVAYAVHSVTDFNLHIPANALLLAFVFGMLATRTARPGEVGAGWRSRWSLALPAALGLWMLVVGGPKFPGELCLESARSKLMAGDAAAGLENAERALKWGIRSPDGYYYIGEARRLLSAGLHTPEERAAAIESAHQAYADGLALFPQDVKLVLITAWTLDKLDRFDEAESLYKKAFELDPTAGGVWAYYAWHNQYGGKPVEALASYQKAAQLCDVNAIMKVVGERLDPKDLERHAAAAQAAKLPKAN